MARKVDDAGEVVTGARKHLTGRALTVADLAGLSPEESADITTKEHVWPQPDWNALLAAGAAADALALVKIIRDRIPIAPDLLSKQQSNRDGDAVRRDYISMVELVRDNFQSVRTMDDAEDARGRVFTAIGWHERKGWADKEVREKLDTICLHNRYPFEILAKDRVRAKKLAAGGFPNQEAVPAWQRGVVFRKDLRSDGLMAVKAGEIVASGFATEAEGLEILRKEWEEKKASKANDPKEPPTRASLMDAERTGMPDWRHEGDVSPEEFIAAFGFRAIQFGESMPDKERQRVVNAAYDGLMDMAHVLGFPPTAVSLDGFLAAAFGARGRGRFPAHYEPLQKVFNLGRLSGAGSLAHEWAHAFDHAAAEANCLDKSRGDVRWMSWGQPVTGNLPEGAGEAWSRVIKTLRTRPKTREEAHQHYLGLATTQGAVIAKQKERQAEFLARGPSPLTAEFGRKMAVWLRQAEDHKKGLERRATDVLAAPEGSGFGNRPTDYLDEANKLCGKSGDYWRRPHELFARAFESMVFDRIAAMGGHSPYLVYAVEPGRYADPDDWKGNPYPTGKERDEFSQAIFDAVEKSMPVFDRDAAPARAMGM